jgi:hypothetical protein
MHAGRFSPSLSLFLSAKMVIQFGGADKRRRRMSLCAASRRDLHEWLDRITGSAAKGSLP